MTVMNHSSSVLLVDESDFEAISSRAEGQSSWLAEEHKHLKPPSSLSAPLAHAPVVQRCHAERWQPPKTDLHSALSRVQLHALSKSAHP
ncbi:hypothetical protein QQF64_001800 [Cirrhinus molitorella]|uniref:Uncharacterized protein n=1 Tax=Cirrhinus molitorella TaxID=172907 RepID=A0ABR3MNH4_9TELE